MNQIKTGALLSYIGLGINILIGLLYTPWMIHSIGRDNFGLYTLAMSIITLFVFDFGLSSAVTRFMAKYIAEGRNDKANNCLSLVYKLYIGIDTILLLILTAVYFFIPCIYESLTPAEIGKFKIVYIIASCFSVISFPFIPLNGVLSANEKFIQLKLCELANKIIIVGTMSACLLMGYGLYALVSVNAFAGIIMIVLKLYCVRRFTDTKINFGYKNSRERKEILGFSGWVTVISVCQRMIFNLAPSILCIMSGAASIAVLGIAITIEGYTYTIASALNGMFLPKVSRIMASDSSDLMPLMIRIGRLQAMVITFIVIIFICVGQNFINLWVGEEFSSSYFCAILLILPSLIQLPQEIASTAMVAANKVKHQAIVFIAMAICNIGLAFWLSSKWNAIGISLSICIAYLVRTIGLNYLYVKDLNLKIHYFFVKTFSKLILPVLLVISAAFTFNHFINTNNWFAFIFEAAILSISFVGLLWLMYMNRDEKNLALSLFRIRRLKN